MLEFADAPKQDITIQSLIFPARLVYETGHELTAVEAGVMCQTRIENLRNNYAAKIKVLCKEHKVEKGTQLPAEVQAELQKQFPVFEEGYEFGTRGGAREVDPVRKQALAFAQDAVKESLRAKNYKLSDIGNEKINAMAADAVDGGDYPQFMEKAKIVVDARNSAAEGLKIDVG